MPSLRYIYSALCASRERTKINALVAPIALLEGKNVVFQQKNHPKIKKNAPITCIVKNKAVTLQSICKTRSLVRVVRSRSAKPYTPVRIRKRPPKAVVKTAAFLFRQNSTNATQIGEIIIFNSKTIDNGSKM